MVVPLNLSVKYVYLINRVPETKLFGYIKSPLFLTPKKIKVRSLVSSKFDFSGQEGF